MKITVLTQKTSWAPWKKGMMSFLNGNYVFYVKELYAWLMLFKAKWSQHMFCFLLLKWHSMLEYHPTHSRHADSGWRNISWVFTRTSWKGGTFIQPNIGAKAFLTCKTSK